MMQLTRWDQPGTRMKTSYKKESITFLEWLNFEAKRLNENMIKTEIRTEDRKGRVHLSLFRDDWELRTIASP